MGLEGHIGIELRRSAGRIAGAAVRSCRPQIAGRLLRGQTCADALGRIPLVFSVCAQAQAAAAAAALAAASDQARDPEAGRRVIAESLHEALWRVLCDWPDQLGEVREAAPLAAMRKALLPLVKGGGDVAAATATCTALLEQSVFAAPVADWCQRAADGGLAAWVGGRATPAARFVATAGALDARRDGRPVAAQALPPLSARDFSAALGEPIGVDGFAAVPTWQGRPAETGPAVRCRHLIAGFDDGFAARLLARLRDAVELLRRLGVEADGGRPVDAAPGAGACGWGVVDTARGTLIHWVRLDGERIADYRIVAPTEWNFHPDGPLAGLVTGVPAADPAAAESIAALAVQALDPCVAHRVEVVDA